MISHNYKAYDLEETKMTRTMDDSTRATDPGGVAVSHQKLRRFHPHLYGFHTLLDILRIPPNRTSFWKTHVHEHLMYGDSRAAVVVSVEPLLVAAYTSDIDCVAMLHFPDKLVQEYDLSEGKHLLTVNTYGVADKVQEDLHPGPGSQGYWMMFAPFIAEFLSDDLERIEKRKSEIEKTEWQRVVELGDIYYKEHGLFARDGRPLYVLDPAKQL